MNGVDKLLLRPQEAAEQLGVGRSKLYSLLATGELPSVRVGKAVRVPAAALIKWVEERCGPRVIDSPETRGDS